MATARRIPSNSRESPPKNRRYCVRPPQLLLGGRDCSAGDGNTKRDMIRFVGGQRNDPARLADAPQSDLVGLNFGTCRASRSTAARTSSASTSKSACSQSPVDLPVPRLSNDRQAMPALAKRSAIDQLSSRVCGPEPCTKTRPRGAARATTANRACPTARPPTRKTRLLPAATTRPGRQAGRPAAPPRRAAAQRGPARPESARPLASRRSSASG